MDREDVIAKPFRSWDSEKETWFSKSPIEWAYFQEVKVMKPELGSSAH